VFVEVVFGRERERERGVQGGCECFVSAAVRSPHPAHTQTQPPHHNHQSPRAQPTTQQRNDQVAAYCNGRSAVSEYDCLLLEHVLWSTPEVAPKIADWLLAQLAVDDGMKQVGGGLLLGSARFAVGP